MSKRELFAAKLKNGHFWAGVVSGAFILSALIIFIIDQFTKQISFPYVIASMLCIYAASISIFIDIVSLRIRDNKNNIFVGLICIVAEIVVMAFTTVIIREYSVLQNELDGIYSLWKSVESITDASLEVYNKYIELSRGMEKFYLQMGILFMLWWVPPFAMTFIRVKKPKTGDEETEGTEE